MTELYTYSYDAWGRPLTVTHRLDTLPAVVLHAYAYDAAGRLAGDGRNGDADLRTNYAYNVRSWLTDIKVGGNAQQGTLGETFTEKLYYQNLRPVNPQSGVQWGGNVSAMDWMAGSDGVGRRYDFAYDGLSRLTGAGYADDGAGQSDYSRGYGYDRNGNVTLLATATDTTQITYLGNHLTSGNNFTYDANGNLTKDLIRSISSISYNILNLPQQVEQQVSLRGGIVPFDQEPTFYLYTASGVKLQSMTGLAAVLPGHPDTRDRTDYVGNLIYDRTSLKKILIDGGYVEVSGNTRNYRFFVKDYLGNNRLVTDASGSILQTNHYDPYGESLPDGAAVDSGNPYKYSGKEYDDKALAYDFGARHYTSSIPRWTTMDPLCEKYYSLSPYAYCANNPVNLVDPEGRKVVPAGQEELNMIKNTLPKESRDFVQLNNNGEIDVNLMKEYEGRNSNFKLLLALVESTEYTVGVTLGSGFDSINQYGEKNPYCPMMYIPADDEYAAEEDKDNAFKSVSGLTTGETGFMGKTLFPDLGGMQNSPTGRIEIIVNKQLSRTGAAETFSHEGYGHALLYVMTAGNRQLASHQAPNAGTELNYLLKHLILGSRRETVKNLSK